MVPPFDHEWIIAGQGTAGLEILEQQPDVAAVLVPIGGGGLAAGVAAAIKLSRPDVKVIGVEPAGAAAMKASIDAGHVRHARSHAQRRRRPDARAPRRSHLRPRPAVRRRVVTVEDEQIIDAVLWIFEHARIVAEPSGAAAVGRGTGRRRRLSTAPSSPSSAAATWGWRSWRSCGATRHDGREADSAATQSQLATSNSHGT